jgi:hypothetical protein
MNIDKNVFNKNLLVTQHYCKVQSSKPDKNKAAILRTINPSIKDEKLKGKRLFEFLVEPCGHKLETKYCPVAKWLLDPTHADNKNLIQDLFKEQIIFKQVFSDNTQPETVCDGRILSIEIDCTLMDGAAEIASNGFIDLYDFPPIDTWIYLAEGEHGKILYAWIPEQFIEDVNSAMMVHCQDILQWVDSDSL